MATINDYKYDPLELLALAIWRQARGRSQQIQCAIGKLLLNRCAVAPAAGFQFSLIDAITDCPVPGSYLDNDPRSRVLPDKHSIGGYQFPDRISGLWASCQAAALQAISDSPDETLGATFYSATHVDDPLPVCGLAVQKTAVIGNLHFYKIADGR